MAMDFFNELSFNKTFSQLAKESNFTFNLYRGRVDWKKLENLDVDRIVRDQDVELLNINTSNVTNCNLESEYDTKILDPSFIKLFRLAQLLIDFLLHCKRYLEHCIKVAYENLQISAKASHRLRTALRETVRYGHSIVLAMASDFVSLPFVEFGHTWLFATLIASLLLVWENGERLQQQLKIRKTEVKQLKKKIQDLKHQLLTSPRFSSPTHKCSLCGKMFLNENYRNGHQSRRHQTRVSVNQTCEPISPSTQTVAGEVKQMENVADVGKMKRKYQEEIEEMKNKFFLEIQNLKQKESGSVNKAELAETSENLMTEIANEDCKDQPENHHKAKVVEEVWQQRIEERERVWRARLAELDQQHKKQVQEMQMRLNTSHNQGQEMKRELEKRIEEVLKKFEQSQALLEKKIIDNQEQNIKKINEGIEGTLEIASVQTVEPKSVPQAPPIQKRKAFVSQKSKTVQEESSVESPKTEPMNIVVKQVQSDVESETEINPPQVKDSSWTNFDTLKDKPFAATSPIMLGLCTKSEAPSINKNKESIITKLLEEEKVINLSKKQCKQEEQIMDDDESSISETLSKSDSESNSSEETKRDITVTTHQEMDSSDDQLLQNETLLAKQSLESMESLLAANPDILRQLREDLEQLCKRRLQDLGVDPGWGGLPPATFQNKLDVLLHQRNLAAKKHKVYFTLRDKLNKDAEAAVHNRPTQSTADTVMQRLRSKVAQVVNAAMFSHRLVKRTLKEQPNDNYKKESLMIENPQLLVSSGPPSPLKSFKPPTNIQKQVFNVPKVLVTQSKDSLSLSSLTSEEDRVDTAVNASSTPSTQVKSALRNAVSTGSLTKKKVLFVDQALNGEKRWKSESEVVSNDSFTTVADLNPITESTSVTDLVKEIQSQLNKRTEKPVFSVDLMEAKVSDSSYKKPDTGFSLPLSQILPLTKSGRELLETEEKLTMQNPVAQARSKKSTPFVLSKLVESNFLSSSSSVVTISGRKGEGETGGGKESLKVSPSHSLTSLGSSLLDISVSPRMNPHTHTASALEWDLQDLEDNLRD